LPAARHHYALDPGMSQPIFIIAPPASGAGILAQSLARASGAVQVREPGGSFLESIEEIQPALRGWVSHALSAEDASALGEGAREALGQSTPEDNGSRSRPIASGTRLTLRVPFLAAAFPGSKFVFMVGEPREALPSMVEAWRSQTAVTCPDLPGWSGPGWSLPLTPGWRDLLGLPIGAIVAEQWRLIVEIALDDLEGLAPERWAVCALEALLEDPRRELSRLCAALELRYDQALLGPAETARRNRRPWPQPGPELERELVRLRATEERLRDLIATPAQPTTARDPEASPFRSVSTGSFGRLLGQMGASLLISTYQAGRLVCARSAGGPLNTHFRQFDKPMGIAVADGRFALGTRTEVIDFRNMPEVAPKVEPPGTHDACYLPRNRHVTGDILIHEMAYARGELWAVATAFSCLATFDADHSFVPRWKPPFISQLTVGDRCHLNGLAVVEDRVAFVTALGRSDEPGGWRANKASGGCLMSVDSSEVVCAGLSMPHSPRWHDGRLWLLESGRGSLATIDLDTGKAETVIELPGFTRGLVLAGDLAFVGLSQIRESSTFGDLPLTERLAERVSGVWIVNTRNGNQIGFLRFEDLVQEVFDLALLPGVRYPEVAEPGSTAALNSFQLP
jgi:uncharacterized protein (TIGR03032 family)